MTILQRYIAKAILASTLLVMLAVASLSFFITLLSEFHDLGSGDYGFSEALIHALLYLPFSIYQFFPMIALLGGVVALGLLAANQEVLIMRASGVSLKKIMLAVTAGAVILILLVTLLGEYISPKANFLANQRKDIAQNNGQAVVTASGMWVHEQGNFYHIEQVTGKNHLEGVTRYQFDLNHHLLASYYSQTMDLEHNHWVLHNLVKTTFNHDHVVSQQFSRAIWNVTLNPNLLTVGIIQPEEMSLNSLFNYNQHLQKNGLQSTEFEFAFWKRVFQPLATIVMILLAIPFVLSYSRSAMIGRRIFFGVLVGFVFYILNAFLSQLSIVLQLSPWAAALFPIFIFASLGYIVTIKMGC